MTNYKSPDSTSPVTYFLVFMIIVSLTFALFFTIMARPFSYFKERMNNTETPWTQVRENIVKAQFNDSPEKIIELLGEPDEKHQAIDQKIFIYYKYGLYKPSFGYTIEFQNDKLLKINTSEIR